MSFTRQSTGLLKSYTLRIKFKVDARNEYIYILKATCNARYKYKKGLAKATPCHPS
jgi:hypothetical protein